MPWQCPKVTAASGRKERDPRGWGVVRAEPSVCGGAAALTSGELFLT